MTVAEAWVEETLGPIELGEVRLDRRLRIVVETMASHPEESIPRANGTWAKTKATDNFLSNPRVDAAVLRHSQAEATAQRCVGLGRVLALQDTTSLDYTSHPKLEGVGPLETKGRRGLLGHSTLAVGEDGVARGLLHQQLWARDEAETGKRATRHERPIEGKESAKWLLGLVATEALVGPDVQVVTVADREADIYELYALAQVLHGDWLIRARHDRALVGEEAKLLATVEAQPVLTAYDLAVPERPGHGSKPAQPKRTARVAVRTATVTVQPPQPRAQQALAQWWTDHPEVTRLAPEKLVPLAVGVVLVTEIDPPAGVEPVRWLLLTSLPVATVQDALTCVRYYRLRWLIERYHFVLKRGCRVERLQLEAADHLIRALAVLAAVAWRVLWLTYLARAEPEAPCTVAVPAAVWPVLWRHTHPRQPLPATPPTLREAVRAIAQLGGFLGRRHDGEPGVQTIWRGLRRLMTWS